MSWDSILKARKLTPEEARERKEREDATEAYARKHGIGWQDRRAQAYQSDVNRGSGKTKLHEYDVLDDSDEVQRDVMDETMIEDKLDVYTDDSCRDELKNLLDKVNTKTKFLESEVLHEMRREHNISNIPNFNKYVTNRVYTDSIPEEIACMALRKIKVTPIGKKEVLGPLDKNGNPWKADSAKPSPYDEEMGRSLRPADEAVLETSSNDPDFEEFLEQRWKRRSLWATGEPPFSIQEALNFAGGKWNTLLNYVRDREKQILGDIKEDYERKRKKTGTSRKRFVGAKSSTDEKYHIVRYYAWRTSRNDKHHMYVNTLNIRKGDKIIYKIGYVINTGLSLTASQKSKFDKEADWR
tara:strand:+ start:122 stop:1183 length:1062 start_codon:yes stop_codon:yes gene_type:complete